MVQDVSGFGLSAVLVAVNTFPVGFPITQFADDADPFDVGAVTIADKAMGLNGDLIVWAKANAIMATLNVIPGSPDDINLGILFDANRVAAGKISAQDIITLTVIYPDGSTVTQELGKCMEYMPAKSVSSSGRLKTKSYTFAFENKIGS